jgi:hypothetical protein
LHLNKDFQSAAFSQALETGLVRDYDSFVNYFTPKFSIDYQVKREERKAPQQEE